MTGRNARELAREFGAFREQRPDIAKPVHHASLSAARGEQLTVEQWNEVSEKYDERMGNRNSPFVVIQHTDTEHDHVHIAASRIDVQGKVVSDFQSKMRAEAVMREVEREHHLVQVKQSHEIERAAPTRGELEELARTGERSTKMVLQDTIDRVLRNGPSTTEFINQMERAGIHINPNVQSTGRVSGICFEHSGEVMKRSNLGRGYSWQGPQKRGLEYQEKRDLPSLKEAKAKYLEAELERGREAGLSREQVAGKEQEIAELRQSVAARSALAQEQEREQERTVSRELEHQPHNRSSPLKSQHVRSPLTFIRTYRQRVR